jgi:arsenical pump membrane protein
MGYLLIASLVIFVVTLFLIIVRPRKMNLGLAAGAGALASLIFGTVSLQEALNSLEIIWDAALAFIGIVLLSVTLDVIGFFRWAALKVVLMARGRGIRLYFYVALLTAAVSILFANDSAILILTPIVVEIIRELKIDKAGSLAYLFGAGLIADTAAMPLITSNPINIVSADYFHYSFLDHFFMMGLVSLATVGVSLAIVFLFFRKQIPRSYTIEPIEDLIKSGPVIRPLWLKASFVTLIAIDIGYIITSLNHIYVSFVICLGALSLLLFYFLTYKKTIKKPEERKGIFFILKRVNWDILAFMIGIFLVVQGLKHVGIINFFASLFVDSSALPSILSILVPSLIVTFGASAMNNWPMTMLGLLSVNQAFPSILGAQSRTGLVFSNIIGNNLGPHFFPVGSLAILMWMGVLKNKGITIRIRDYLKIGALLSLIEVGVASLVLWIELNWLQMFLPL